MPKKDKPGVEDSIFKVHRLGTLSPCSFVAAGAISSFAVEKTGSKLYAWGSQQNGQLGVSLETKSIFDKPTPVQEAEISKIAEIACGDSSTIVRARKGEKIYGWGRGFSLERNLDISRFKPKELLSVET